MSTPIPNDGGPAFPEPHYFDPSRGPYGMHVTASDVGCGGMSLRDLFAATVSIPDEIPLLVAEAIMETPLPKDTMGQILWSVNARSKLRYIQADAMLAARSTKPPTP